MEEERRLLRILKNLSYEEGDFLLVSGKRSTFYIDCKETTLNPKACTLSATSCISASSGCRE
jgi:orotate phosphoribosyltransferase